MTATIYVDDGTELIVDRADGTATATTDYIGWGTGGSSTGGTATNTDSALRAEATQARVLATRSQPSADTNQWLATITHDGPTGSKTIEEAGIFTTTTGGTMIIRASHGGVVLATDDAIQYTFTLQQT